MNSITLLLDGHCIETTARKRLTELIRKSLTDESSDEYSGEIEFLREFIERTDFRRIRADNPFLDGRTRIKVIVELNSSREYLFRIIK